MSTFSRYVLFQIPGWVVVGAGLVWLDFHDVWGMTTPLALGLFAVFVAKDFALYPWLRRSYEPSPRVGVALLIGERATARSDFDVSGYVRIRGELWKAELVPGSPPVSAGQEVVVRSTRGMTLVVEEV